MSITSKKINRRLSKTFVSYMAILLYTTVRDLKTFFMKYENATDRIIHLARHLLDHS